MARSVNNVLTKGLSGMIGKQLVFRTWNGKTFISVAPRKPKKQSPLQQENRGKFKKATQFAKKMMKDPEKKAEYQELAKKLKLPNAYTAAITEYMRKPEVKDVDLSEYTGKGGEQIKISAAKKGFEIQEVEVIIASKDGIIIEERKASKKLGSEWLYQTAEDVKDHESVEILIKSRDRAGNVYEKLISKTFT